MTLVSNLLKSVDKIRGIPDGSIGARPYVVTVRVRTYAADGLAGTWTDTDTVVSHANGQRPKCRRVNYKETVAGGGRYQQGDWRLGPLTPDYAGGGIAFATMTPTRTGANEVLYIVVGPDTPAGGEICNAVALEADRPITRFLVLRPTGATA